MIKEALGIGETIETAKVNALQRFPVKVTDDLTVNFDVLQYPVKKTFGLFGGKSAKVRAYAEILPAQLAAKYVYDVLYDFGLRDFVVEIEQKDERIELHVLGDNLAPIIGRRGELLDNIQYLAGLVANSGESEYFRITINAGDYRERREKALSILASKVAYKSLRMNKRLSLEPMTPYERRVLHKAIEQIPGVTSFSEGEGERRHLVVEPTDPVIAANFRKRYYEKKMRYGNFPNAEKVRPTGE